MKKNKLLLPLLGLLLLGSGYLGFKVRGLSSQNQKLEETNRQLAQEVLEGQARKKDLEEAKKYENKNRSLTSKEIRLYGPESFKTDFKEENLDLISDEFIDPLAWEDLGFSQEDALVIGGTLGQNPRKTRSIISAMLKANKSLKLILLPRDGQLYLKYGAEGVNQEEKMGQGNKLAKSPPNNQAIKSLELDIDYEDKSVEADYSIYKGQVKASLEDELSQVYLYGEEAKSLLEEKILGLNFPATRDLAIDDSLKALGLKKNFTSYKISIDYENGQSFNYKLNTR